MIYISIRFNKNSWTDNDLKKSFCWAMTTQYQLHLWSVELSRKDLPLGGDGKLSFEGVGLYPFGPLIPLSTLEQVVSGEYLGGYCCGEYCCRALMGDGCNTEL